MRLIACLLAAFLSRADAAQVTTHPCPSVVILGAETIDLTDVERGFICGRERAEGWETVPLNQAEYFLRSFLQRRGYDSPAFEAANGVLTVRLGPKAVIRKIEGTGLPPGVDLSRRRKLIGRTLTPEALDALQAWAVEAQQDAGYACPKVELRANAATGEVDAAARPGPAYAFPAPAPPEGGPFDPRVLERFQAFRVGDPFDLRLLALTSSRLQSEDLFLSAYYDVACSSGVLALRARVVPAKPRVAAIGFGVDTEGYLRARARWTNAGLDRAGSSLSADLFASYLQQSLVTAMNWYPEPASRFHLAPSFSALRQNQPAYAAASADAALDFASGFEAPRGQAAFSAGPAVEYVNTLRGVGPPPSVSLLMRTKLEITSHLFELYRQEPRVGSRLTLDAQSRLKGVFSPFGAQRMLAGIERLWNLGRYDPPLFVLGWRGSAGTTASRQPPAQLPPTLRFFLGGDADMRGFSLNELPAAGDGFLTEAYQGLELRLVETLPYKLQPLVFVDAALGGRTKFSLDRTLYWSPGLGLRWSLPIGSLRATIAHGFIANPDPAVPTPATHWQLYVNFGQEF